MQDKHKHNQERTYMTIIQAEKIEDLIHKPLSCAKILHKITLASTTHKHSQQELNNSK